VEFSALNRFAKHSGSVFPSSNWWLQNGQPMTTAAMLQTKCYFTDEGSGSLDESRMTLTF